MAEDEIIAFKEALSNQNLIKKLYTELEEERKASASGADEALSMILRLQQEKAEEKMKACQYKRMAEAKIHHAEESLEILQDLMLHKEIEIASLKNQVKAYKHILLSIGVNNSNFGDIKVGNRRFSRSSAFLEKTSSRSKVRRQISLPSIQFDKSHSEMDVVGGDCSLIPPLHTICRGIGDYQDELKEQQRYHLSKELVIKEERNPDSEQAQEINEIHSVSIQDIFEVPRSVDERTLSKSSKQVLQEPFLEAKEMIGMPKSQAEALDYFLEDNFSEKAFKLSAVRRGASLKYCSTLMEPKVGSAPTQTDVQQLKFRMQQLEDDIRIMKQEDLKRGYKQWNLLGKINEQLNTIQLHLKSSKVKRCSEDDSLFVALTEAMLSFSI